MASTLFYVHRTRQQKLYEHKKHINVGLFDSRLVATPQLLAIYKYSKLNVVNAFAL